ncbi:MAG TPA: hypothetical protein VEQ18_02680 [Candidatus Nitrosocosmicus sp.]|nr:hypothetical protein [Candidatus Nitrosocosmicus sp.]
MATLNWDNTAQLSHFKFGLRKEIKELLIHQIDLPTSFTKFAEICKTLDNRWHALQQENRQIDTLNLHNNIQNPIRSTSTPQPIPSTSSGTHPRPIDLENTRRRKLTNEEKQFRRDNNLCLFCGQPNHYANNCPQLANPQRVSSMETTPEATSSPEGSKN